MNNTDLLAKPWMCNTLGSLRKLLVVWEQFHDCQLLLTASRIFSLRRFLRWNPWVGYFFLRNSLDRLGCFSDVFWEENIHGWLFLRNKYPVTFVLPLLLAKWRRPLGSSSWKLLELTSVSNTWPMSLTPMNGESVWLVEKKTFMR